jgi:hypothetical protein
VVYPGRTEPGAAPLMTTITAIELIPLGLAVPVGPGLRAMLDEAALARLHLS